MRHGHTIAAASALLLGVSFHASPQGVTPKFEVASVKECLPTKSGDVPSDRTFPGGLTLRCGGLKMLIMLAYTVFDSGKADPLNPGLPSMLVEGLPAWVDSARFEINARTETPQSSAMMRGPMMQALLEERFGLKVHREKREAPVYFLTVAGSQPKLHATQEGTCSPLDFSDLNVKPSDGPFCAVQTRTHRGDLSIMDLRGITMGAFARMWTIPGRPVIDQTGLKGAYDIHLEFGPDQATVTDDAPPAMVALREQLGLQMTRGKGIVEFLVIDHIDKPTPN